MTEIIVVIGKGVWVCLKELCARAERESQDRQNKYSHHLAIDRYLMVTFASAVQKANARAAIPAPKGSDSLSAVPLPEVKII